MYSECCGWGRFMIMDKRWPFLCWWPVLNNSVACYHFMKLMKLSQNWRQDQYSVRKRKENWKSPLEESTYNRQNLAQNCQSHLNWDGGEDFGEITCQKFKPHYCKEKKNTSTHTLVSPQKQTLTWWLNVVTFENIYAHRFYKLLLDMELIV